MANDLAKIRKRANREATAATTICFAPSEWKVIDAEIERLRGYLAMWESNCTGHHGSQSSCGMTADNGVAPDRPAPKSERPPQLGDVVSFGGQNFVLARIEPCGS